MMTEDRIQQRMRVLNLRSVDIVKMTKLKKGTISQWINGRTQPKGKGLFLLAQSLKCDPLWLITGETQIELAKKSNAKMIGGFDLWDDQSEIKANNVAITYISETRLSAGDGAVDIEEKATEKIAFSLSSLEQANVKPKDAICIGISGNSMEPLLSDGATIGIDTSKKKIKDGEIYAINNDGLLQIKFLHLEPSGGLRIRSNNPDKIVYPDIIYDSKETSKVKIIGRYFWHSFIKKIID